MGDVICNDIGAARNIHCSRDAGSGLLAKIIIPSV